MKINKIYIPLLLSITIALGVIIGNKLPPSDTYSLYKNKSENKIIKLINHIETKYVDSINTDSIVDITIKEVLKNLDPHSVYINKKEHLTIDENMQGDFVGIGINFYMYKDTLAVIKTIAGGPSEQNGILPGDRILFADDYQLFGKNLPNDSLFSKLKGKKDTEVTLSIYRKKNSKFKKITLKRNTIPLKSVDIGIKINDSLGYIKINRFAETTYTEFYKSLLHLKEQGIKELILDIRGNGGGYLEMAISIADEFLKKDNLIVTIKNRENKTNHRYATKKGIFEEGKIFVLIDENSASASEILAGALQDNDRAILLGRRSFGKGLVQEDIPLDDGSSVRLTVARYYTPSGRSIQKPFDNLHKENYFNEIDARLQNGELFELDSIKVIKKLQYTTKNGRIIYGGGGIVPDVFIPFTTSKKNIHNYMLMQSNLVDFFVFETLDNNRAFFESLSPKQLKEEIYSNATYFSLFENYLQQYGWNIIPKNKNIVLPYLHAEFARQLFSDELYYDILIQNDRAVKKICSSEYTFSTIN